MKVLDIGCGNGKTKSENPGDKVIGVDFAKLKGVDVVHDLEKTPLPFRKDEFDAVIANHVLEHIRNFVPLMNEIWRITKKEGVVRIKTPFYSSWGQFNDPTRVRFFTPFTFSYFEGESTYSHEVKKANKGVDFKVERVRINFGIGKSSVMNKILNPLLNINHRFYCRFFAWVFPAAEIEFVLRVIK
jgi:SAM-dependent methyltransferase